MSEKKQKDGNSLADEKDTGLASDLVHREHYLRSSVCKTSITAYKLIHGILSAMTGLYSIVEDNRMHSLTFV